MAEVTYDAKSMADQALAPTDQKPHGRSKRARRVRHWLLGIGITLIVAWFLFAQSPLTPRLVLPPLARLLGVGVAADGVSIGINGVVAFDRLRFTVDDEDTSGPASVLAEAKRATGRLKMGSLMRGRIRLSELVLIEPTVRVSQSTETGKLNLAEVSIVGQAANTPNAPPEIGEVPTIVVSGGAVLLGEHNRSSFTLLRRLDVDGSIEPVAGPERGFDFRFHEVPAHDSSAGTPLLDLRGTLTGKGLTLDLTGFALDAWPARVLPGSLRSQVAALELAGRVNRATLSYDFRGMPSGRLDLEDVAVTLPVASEAVGSALPTETSGARLRMTKTSGWIELSDAGLKSHITGMLEDIPYIADLTTTSSDPDGPFTLVLTSSGYELSKNPPFRRFLNDTVRERLRDFGNPTGTTTTIATITRGPKTDAGPGEITTKGQLRITNGVAAFHKFPYEFRDITATLNFSENAIEIASLQGTALSGATISAKGTISPLTDGAAVALDIVTRNIPIDETLEAAMKPGERDAVKRIFSRDDFARLTEAGMLAPAAGSEPFAFRGMCDITVRLTRDLGDEGEWHQDIRVNIPKAGMLAEPFPLPAMAHNLQLVIGDDAATVTCEDLRPIAGGQATLHASVDLAELRKGEDVTPNVTIHAKGVPMDALSRQAILMAATRKNETGRERLRTLITQCNLAGTVDALVEVFADVTPGAQPGDIGVQVRADGFSAQPALQATPEHPRLQQAWALLTANDREVDLAVGGVLSNSTTGQASSPENRATDDLKVRLRLPQMGEAGRPRTSIIDVDAKALDLQTPMDRTLEVFTQDAAAAVRSQAALRGPTGRANVSVRAAIDDLGLGSQVVQDLSVRVDGFSAASILEKGERITLMPEGGSLSITQNAKEAGTRVRIDDLRGQARLNDGSAHLPNVRVQADILVTRNPGGEDVPSSGMLELQASGVQLASASARRIAGAHAPVLNQLVSTYDPAGECELALRVDFSRPPSDPLSVTGSLRPATLQFNSPLFPGKRIALSQGSGAFEFNSLGGTFANLAARGSTWGGTVNGSVVFNHTPGTPRFDTTVSVSGNGLPDDLQAVLPLAIREVLTDLSISLTPDAAFSLDDAKIAYIAGDTPASQSLSTAGTLRFSGGQADIGVWLKDATGSLKFSAERESFDRPGTWSINAEIAQATAAKVRLTDLRFQAENAASDGDVNVSSITAQCHGGRLAGTASVLTVPTRGPVQPEAQPTRSFEVSLRAAGIHFAPVLEDLKVDDAAKPAEGSITPPSRTLVNADASDVSRGILDGDASIRGIVGQPESRSGRGSITVGGGRILPSSGLMQLIRVSNLQFPSDEPLDLARANWFLTGPAVSFEEISVASRSVSIVGYGTMMLPGMELDLRFDSRSARRIPLISKVVEMVRDQLITTRVRGTAQNPKFEVVAVPLAGRALNSMAGKRNDQILERLRQEADARRDRDSD